MRRILILGILAGCAQPSAPEWVEKGELLLSSQGYPGPKDICRIAGESPATAQWLGDQTTLIACPIGITLPGAEPVAQVSGYQLFVVN